MAINYMLQQGVYRIANFDKAKEECENFIKVATAFVPSGDIKEIKKARTVIRKKSEEIATLRKEATKAMVMAFQSQCKELEKMLNDADANLTEIINATKEVKPKSKWKVSCTVSDGETLQKLINFMNQLGLEAKVE